MKSPSKAKKWRSNDKTDRSGNKRQKQQNHDSPPHSPRVVRLQFGVAYLLKFGVCVPTSATLAMNKLFCFVDAGIHTVHIAALGTGDFCFVDSHTFHFLLKFFSAAFFQTQRTPYFMDSDFSFCHLYDRFFRYVPALFSRFCTIRSITGEYSGIVATFFRLFCG